MNKLLRINSSLIIKFVLIVGIIAVVVALYTYNNPSYPTFTYDSTKVDGWWASDNTNLQSMAKSLGNRYTGDVPVHRLPVTDVSVHHGENSSTPSSDGCFVGLSYFDYALDSLDAAYETYENRKKDEGNLKVLEPTKQNITTFEGDKGFELRQYEHTIDGEDVLSGYQIGFVSLANGYIRIEGVCKTADDLPLTLPVMQAAQLHEH